jgi:HK97 gp10 family phage protein
MMKGALIIRDEARDIVPVVTGTLRDSIFAAYGDPKKADVIVGVNTRMAVDQDSEDKRTYAGIVEYGDDTRAPHPYMRPAINAARPLVARVVAEETLKAIQDLTKELG